MRAAKHCSGWAPAGLSPKAIKEKLVRLSSYLEEEGRSLEGFEVAMQTFVSIGRDKEEANKKLKNSGLYHHIMSLKASTFKGDDITTLDDFNLIGNGARLGHDY